MNKQELLQQIKRLTTSSNVGERENASKMLEKLCKKYNISLDDLDDEKEERYSFKYKGKYEKRIVLQCIFMVKNCNTISGYSERGKYNTKCTKAQYIEILAVSEFYKRVWQKEINEFLTAFIWRNDITSHCEDETKEAPKPLPNRDSILAKMHTIERAEYYKQLQSGGVNENRV